MPNHYTNILILWPPAEGPDGEWEDPADWVARVGASAWAKDPIGYSLPMPAEVKNAPCLRAGEEPWYLWAKTTWGTKWGSYKVQPVTALPGDANAAQLVFVTAWSPPIGSCRRAVFGRAHAEGLVSRITWMGLDPCDDSAAIVADLQPRSTP